MSLALQSWLTAIRFVGFTRFVRLRKCWSRRQRCPALDVCIVRSIPAAPFATNVRGRTATITKGTLMSEIFELFVGK